MSEPTWIGRKIGGRYEIQELLGQGGMAAVYKAFDPNLRRVVALKLIHSHLSREPEFIARFEAEAAAVAQLRHPHIIQVHDFDRENDVFYIVFEFLPGETLQQHINRLNQQQNGMEYGGVIKVGSDIAGALQYAHSRGLIHRDVKPANVMLNFNGEAILMDFGIVKITGGTQHTATGAVLGTARYMAPEQIRGEMADHRTDIYALGIMLFEMLCGRAPYEADSVMTLMMMQVNDPVPDPQALKPNLPPDLARIITRTLQKDKASRYQSAEDLRRDLQTVRFDLPDTIPSAQSGPAALTPPAVAAPERPTAADPQPVRQPAASTTVQQKPVQQQPVQQQPVQQKPVQQKPIQQKPVQQKPEPAAAAATAQPASFLTTLLANQTLVIGIAAVIILGILGVWGISALTAGEDGAGDVPTAEVVDQNDPGPTSPAAAIVVIDDPTATSQPTTAPTRTMKPTATKTAPTATTAPPTATSAPPTATTAPPTATNVPPTAVSIPPTATSAPPAAPQSVLITGISLSGGYYQVEYTTYGYTEQLPGMHIHFFFNNVLPEQAGIPGSGPWYLWGGPRPFNGYSTSERPANATQMCALVANADHSVIQGTGNCLPLP